MVRLKCKKCGNVFEQNLTAGVVLGPHLGPYKRLTYPACGKGGWFNVYSSVKDPVTWSPPEKKRIEESKYERT